MMLSRSIKENIIKSDKKNINDNRTSRVRDYMRNSMVDINHSKLYKKFINKIKDPSLIASCHLEPTKTNKDSAQLSIYEEKVLKTDFNNIPRKSVNLGFGIIRKKGTKRVTKLNIKFSEDERFLRELLFKSLKEINKNKSNKGNNTEKSKISEKSEKSKDINNFDRNDKKMEKAKFEEFRNYIIKNQNNFNQDFELFFRQIYNENDDIFEVKKLENLIARYSVIIFFVLKNNFEEAHKLFLLMLQENEKYIDLFEYKIYKSFSKLERKKNILKLYPKTAKPLFKIFSSIIKFSITFNLTRYKNKYLLKYLSLHSLNYRIFRKKYEIRGFTSETKNNIKYWFSINLHYASYFALYNYISLKIPLALSDLILKVYKNVDESLLNSTDKSLLVNTSYNSSLIAYVNGQNEIALRNLEKTKQRIISYYGDKSPSILNPNNYNNNIYNNISNISLRNFNENAFNNSFSSSLKKIINRKNTIKKKSLFSKYQRGADNYLNNSIIGTEDVIHQILSNSNRKNSIRMDGINSLFLLEMNKAFNKSKSKKLSINENNLVNLINLKNEYDVGQKNTNEYTSRISIMPLLDIKNYNIPKYIKNPLLIKVELLMCEIEIDKKNYYNAYEHIKTSIVIMFMMKHSMEGKLYENFKEEIRIMLTYLNQIEELNDIKIKKKQKSILKKRNKGKNNSNRNLVFSSDKLIKVDNNNAFSNIKNDKYSNNDSIDFSSEFKNGFFTDEIEKFFIFLNSLSLYQIKILNDFQPTTKNKNDLPILFHGQFKDSLSIPQRKELEKLHTMTLSRYMILEDPDKPIYPSNLRFTFLNKKYKDDKNKNGLNNNLKVFTTSNNSKSLEEESEDQNNTCPNFDDPMFYIVEKTKEHEIFQRIIMSEKCNADLRKFFIKDYDFVIKIIKNLSEDELEDIMNNPQILVNPIKTYIKNNKICEKFISVGKNRQCIQLNNYNYLFRNSDKEINININKKLKTPKIKKIQTSFYNTNDFSFLLKKENNRDISFNNINK